MVFKPIITWLMLLPYPPVTLSVSSGESSVTYDVTALKHIRNWKPKMTSKHKEFLTFSDKINLC